MYQRFLNNNDYYSIVTKEALEQLTRGDDDRLAQAEEAAEQSILEYLSENYEVERVLNIGKSLTEYNSQITYPAKSFFYYEGNVYQALRTIKGYEAPMSSPYWEVIDEYIEDTTSIPLYSQLGSYTPEETVWFNGVLFKCLDFNGIDYNNVRVPGLSAWEKVGSEQWEANVPYNQWAVVSYNGKFYTLMDNPAVVGVDLTKNPNISPSWGLIGNYTPDYKYELTDYEYVVYEGAVYRPIADPNNDKPEVGKNIKLNDPRHPNLKKHLLRLAVYELYKLVTPSNMSQPRITDYETSIIWLRDAGKLRINPQLPRRLEESKPIADFAIATFSRGYDPYENAWQV